MVWDMMCSHMGPGLYLCCFAIWTPTRSYSASGSRRISPRAAAMGSGKRISSLPAAT